MPYGQILERLESAGAALTVDGQPADPDLVRVAFRTNKIEKEELERINEELRQTAIDMHRRALPTSWIPPGEKRAPTLNFNFNPAHGGVQIGARWDRSINPEARKDSWWDWLFK